MELKLDNKLLTTACDKFDFNNPIFDPVELSNAMTVFRDSKSGVGLAANQVGINTRVISIRGIDSALFNPVVVHSSLDLELSEEGCLSFPGLAVKIKRAKTIRVRSSDAFGKVTTKAYNGLTARVILHEIDHIDGILFYNRSNKYYRDQAFRKASKFHTLG